MFAEYAPLKSQLQLGDCPNLELVRQLGAEWSPRALFKIHLETQLLAQQGKLVSQFVVAVV